VGLLGLIGTQGHLRLGLLTGFASSATGSKGKAMPIHPGMLAQNLATLTSLDPEQDLASSLLQAVVAAKQLLAVDAAGVMLADHDGNLRRASASDERAQSLEDNQEVFAAGPCMEAYTSGRPAMMHDATMERRWGEITSAFVELQIRSGLSVPLRLGGGPIGTLDVYAAAPGGWDATEVHALQTYAGLVATLLGTAATAEASGRPAQQLQGALMEREPLDDQQAFINLRPAPRSSSGELPEADRESSIGLPLPHGPAVPAGTADGRVLPLDMGALDTEVAAFLQRTPAADGGTGQKLSLLLLGFLATEVLPLANRLAELRIDPTPLFTAVGDILRLHADILERPYPGR
jgi:hypothetical protein